MSDYKIHLGSRDFASLFTDEDDDTDDQPHPFHEDMDELDRIISEEIGQRPVRPKRPRFVEKE